MAVRAVESFMSAKQWEIVMGKTCIVPVTHAPVTCHAVQRIISFEMIRVFCIVVIFTVTRYTLGRQGGEISVFMTFRTIEGEVCPGKRIICMKIFSTLPGDHTLVADCTIGRE